MKNLDFLKTLLLLALGVFTTNSLVAQCETWVGSPKESAATDAHTIYRGHVKNKDLKSAYEQWKIAYEIAPAADGKRDFHYTDGIKIHMDKFNTSEGADKEAAKEMVLKLYDQVIECFESGAITMKQSKEERVTFHKTRKAFDMFYYLQIPYSENMAVVEDVINTAGNDTEYTLLDPYARMAVTMFTNEKIDKAKAREVNDIINKIADHNIANNEEYGSYYKQAKESSNGVFAEIADNIFDCDYFLPAIQSAYDANPDDPTTIKNTINELRRRACGADHPLMTKLEAKYAQYATAENARRQAEFEANNPAMMAKKARQAGDFAGAIAKYNEAISSESDPSKQALYHFQIGQIKGKKMKDFSAGKAAANRAIELRPDWGDPHILIGDLYIQNSKKCGDAIKQKCCYIAAVDKYRKAKSVDPACNADEKISRYSGTRPEKENAFMQGYKEGQTISLPCIGTSVKLRF